ncbi:MAG TPA: hypothetical protein VM347_23920 [Nonomuraea sp.]|nr:hypothetical protein [Nonomuraea sp.]
MTLDHLTVVPEEGLLTVPPRGLVSLLGTVVRARAEVALAVERGTTMSELASTLAGQDRAATATAYEPDGTSWTISLGPAEATEITEAAQK